MFRQLVRRTASIGRNAPTKTLAPHVPSSSALVASFHASSRDENTLILGGAAIAVSAVVLQYVVKAVSNMPSEPEAESKEEKEKETLEGHSSNTEAPSSSSEGREANEAAGKKAAAAGATFYASWFEKQFYKGTCGKSGALELHSRVQEIVLNVFAVHADCKGCAA